MRKTKILLALLFIFSVPLFPFGSNPARASSFANASEDRYKEVPQSYVIKSSNIAETKAHLSNLGINSFNEIEKLGYIELSATESQVEKVKTQKSTLFIEKNIDTKIEQLPNDYYFAQQTHLTHSNIVNAWEVTSGDPSIIVGVLDTGVNYNHEDLVGKMWRDASGRYGKDFVNDDDDPMDDNGHGTMIAGIIAATKNNSVGGAGVANVKIMAIKAAPSEDLGDVADLARAVVYAVDNGAKILNISMGSIEESILLNEAIEYSKARNVLIVSSSGNEGYGIVRNPARNPYVIGVGAISANNAVTSYSNYGSSLGMVALGDSIISTSWSASKPTNLYQKGTGTSFSTPQVTGAAALLLARDPSLSANQIHKRLLSSAAKVPAMLGNSFSSYYGYGKLDAYKALTYDISSPLINIDSFLKDASGVFNINGYIEDEKGSQGILGDTPTSNITTVRYKIDGGAWNTLNSSALTKYNLGLKLPEMLPGEHVITIEAFDTSGNKQTKLLTTTQSVVAPASKNPSDYRASLVYQSPYPNLVPGQAYQMKLTYQNTGTTTWNRNEIRLGTTRPMDRTSIFADSSWLSGNRIAMKEEAVLPGSYANFEFTFTLPNNPVYLSKTYKEYFNLVAEGVAWFPDIGMYWDVKTSSPSYHAQFIDQSPYLVLNKGEEMVAWADYKNTGSYAWGSSQVHLGTSNPLDRQSAFYSPTGWASANRINMNKSVANPGEVARFEFTIKAPNQAGTYKESFRPVVDGVTWMEDYGLYWNFTVQ